MKRTPFARIVSLMMAILLLVSSMGFAVVEHTCEMKGKSHSAHLGHGAISSCCATEAPSNSSPVTKRASGIRENPCCKEKAMLSPVAVAVTPEATSQQLVPTSSPLALAAYLVFGGSYFIWDAKPTFHPYAGPPPVSVSLYKALLCSWLI